MKLGSFLVLMAVFLPPTAAASLRGNLNFNYRGTESDATGAVTSNVGQTLNLYVQDRIFYSNDLTFGFYVFHQKASDRKRPEFRTRYTLNMAGYRYSLYSAYSPYTIFSENEAAQRVRIFQASLSYIPKLLPELLVSLVLSRQYTVDKPRTKDGSNYLWNASTRVSKSFGNFRGVFQEQRSRTEEPYLLKQDLQTINMGYDIGKQFPARISWSASYDFTASRNKMFEVTLDKNLTHTGAARVSRGFGQWLVLSAASSGRFSEFNRPGHTSRIEDLFASSSANVKLKENLNFSVMRGYSSNEVVNDNSARTLNDYVNISSSFSFQIISQSDALLTVSRTMFLKSTLERSRADNASVIIDTDIYRETSVTANFGVSRNDRVAIGHGRYQMTRNLSIVSRPTPKMSLNFSYQSSLSSDDISITGSDIDVLSINLAQTLKPYFNYSATYMRTIFQSGSQDPISSGSLAANYRLARNLSLLVSYAWRGLLRTEGNTFSEIDQSLTGRISWIVNSRSNINVNYSISNMNTHRESQGIGADFVTSF
ncbi:MAG: hypothetical protein CO189_07635 [candidate division Zixibacteria bacterium CG_4_9_14_3_um_filter_46_8]|nr:MAG: hypothetical protein CO189_07635 [candidate division Zixibacteria bacterium CG_4_9_14_3_um_filter_46_8]